MTFDLADDAHSGVSCPAEVEAARAICEDPRIRRVVRKESIP